MRHKVFFLALGCAGLLHGADDDLTILFTGRLLGYARDPQVQQVSQWGWLVDGQPTQANQAAAATCADRKGSCQRLYVDEPGAGGASDAAIVLARLVAEGRQKAPNSVLLGMGDNFAMDYLARVVVATLHSSAQEYISKDLLYYDSAWKMWIDLRDKMHESTAARIRNAAVKGGTDIAADNVASFITSLHYDALVPGKHDFFYGPERLRQLTGLLAKHGTVMLSANLILQSTVVKKPPELDSEQRARRRDFALAVADMKWALPNNILPWNRSFRLKNFVGQNGAQRVNPGSPARLCETNDRDRITGPCNLLLKGKQDGTDLVYRLNGTTPIPARHTYQLCVDLTPRANAKDKLCTPVDISVPFLQYPHLVQMPGMKLPPWVASHGVVIMGAVAMGLEAQAGALNRSYIDEDHNNDTFAATMDPGEALKQLLDFCEEDAGCKDRPKILMAQMPRDEAAMLNERLDRKFFTVLAQSDRRMAIDEQEAHFSAGHRPVVLVPGEVVQPYPKPEEAPFGVRLQTAVISGLPGRSVAVTTSASKHLAIAQYGVQQNSPCLAGHVAAAYRDFTHTPPSRDPDADFRLVMLEAMRRALKADVALVQERDFFDLSTWLKQCQALPVTNGAEPVRATVEQILWKGDFLVSRTITGAALKAALTESEKRRNLDQSYAIRSVANDWLRYFGVWQDAQTKTWYVNGAAIEDKAPYSVAMTDYLASGDTGYTDLKDPVVPPGPRPADLHALRRISDVVFDTLTAQQTAPLNAPTYLDQSASMTFVAPPRANLWRQVAAITHVFFTKVPDLTAPENRLAQTRPYWRLLVDKGEISFTSYSNNMTTVDQLNEKFSGTSQSGVLAAQSGTLPFAVQVELRREQASNHYFSRTEMDYKRQSQQQKGAAGRFLTTYPSNKLTIETGFRSTFGGSMRTHPWTGWLLSAYGETNLHRPVLDGYTAGVICGPEYGTTCPGTLSFTSDLPRTHRLLMKAGIRREHLQNWAEAGLFGGVVFRPGDFRMTQAGTAMAGVCRLSDLYSEGKITPLNSCLSKTFLVYLNTPAETDAMIQALKLDGRLSSRPESGIFLNWNYRMPVPQNRVVKDISFEQRGQWFFNSGGDTIVDARLVENISVGPTIAIIPAVPGLSLKPTYTWFFYENKRAGNLLEGRTFDLKLEYRFDWRTGAARKQVLRYGRPR